METSHWLVSVNTAHLKRHLSPLNHAKMRSARIRVSIADDNALLRAGIRGLVERLDGVEVVGETGVTGQLLNAIKNKRPNALIMEIGASAIVGMEILARVVKQFPEVKVVVLSSIENEDFVTHALNAGASGYLLKHSKKSELESALRAVAGGSMYICNALAGKFEVLTSNRLRHRKSSFEDLTPRQRQILRFIAESRNTKEIASLMKLSAKTVAFHRVQLMKRLNIYNVPGLVRYAIRFGLVSL